MNQSTGRLHWVVCGLFCLSTAACAASTGAEPRTPGRGGVTDVMPGASASASPPGAPVQANTQVISSGGEAGTASELFERGKRLLLEEKYAEAARHFELVLQGDPKGRLGPMALMNAGLAHEGAGARDVALERYRALVEKHPTDELVKSALLRIGRVSIAGERWADLGKAAEALLARADVSVSEKIEGLGAKALAMSQLREIEGAERAAEQARTLMEKHHIGEVGRVPHEVAMVFFSLGEVRRIKSEKLVFDPMPASFGEAFEARAQGLLDAQSAYTDTMRTTDVFWGTWAGYRVGQLYQQLHHDVMVVKVPDKVKTDKDRALFEGAMQLRYRILLEKGLKMMEATIKVNADNIWSSRAREAKAELEREIAKANVVIKKSGKSEEALKAALEELAKAKK